MNRQPAASLKAVAALRRRLQRWQVAWWARLRPARATVPLDLHQQLVMLTLAARGPCGFQRLLAEVGALRPVTPAELTTALLLLDAAALIERAAERSLPQAQRPYALTRRGRQAARIIPTPPRSALNVYL